MRTIINAETGEVTEGPELVLPLPDPAEVLAAQHAAINAERDRRMQIIADGYTPTERETWSVQSVEAAALKGDPDAPAPMLRAIAASQGVPVMALADRVLALSSAFAAATGAVMGAASVLRHMDPIPDDVTDDQWWP